MADRRCAHEGCRSHPLRAGGDYCVAHAPDRVRGGGAPEHNQNARTHGGYSSYVPIVAVGEALTLPPGDLRVEVAVVRALIGEVLKSGQPVITLADPIDRLTGALARLLRVNKQLDDGSGGELDEIVSRVLDGLGQGGS